MVVLLFSGIVLSYCLRITISVAAQEMRTELNWSEKDKGYVLVRIFLLYGRLMIDNGYIINVFLVMMLLVIS